MSDFLAQMAASSAARVARARKRHGEAQMLQFAEVSAPAPPLVLHDRFSVFAEIKSVSPAEGALADGTLDRGKLANAYAANGASAVSVLTEPERFGGDLEHLAEVASLLAKSNTPAMRKDFLVDPYQVAEARIAGAGGVLLIMAMLEDSVLERMLGVAVSLGLFVLIECFDQQDLRRASRALESSTVGSHLDAGQVLLGVNTRDLRTLEVDPHRLADLAPYLPKDLPVLAESGLKTADDAARAAGWGYRGALIGTALMRADDPGTLLQSFVDAGRGR